MGTIDTNSLRQPLIDAWNAIAGEGSNAAMLVDSLLPAIASYKAAALAGSAEDASDADDLTAQVIADAGIYGIDVEAVGEKTIFAFITTAIKIAASALVVA